MEGLSFFLFLIKQSEFRIIFLILLNFRKIVSEPPFYSLLRRKNTLLVGQINIFMLINLNYFN
ncbi:hypothetical protein B0A63_23840 [Flavobacterium johnsoniae UW101]|nr:hypothetical protein B0A63_23840 [Flavobacterium johnsoniae UW101]